MNALGTDVLKAMESSSLGRMSIYVLSKQTSDLGIDLENLSHADLPKLTSRLKAVLPFFLANETDEVLNKIRKLNNNTVVST